MKNSFSPSETPGRIPELEPTRINAEYWKDGAEAQSSPGQARICYEQAINAWKNAAYAMADKLALALDHIEKDDKEIERLHSEIAALRSNPSANEPFTFALPLTIKEDGGERWIQDANGAGVPLGELLDELNAKLCPNPTPQQ